MLCWPELNSLEIEPAAALESNIRIGFWECASGPHRRCACVTEQANSEQHGAFALALQQALYRLHAHAVALPGRQNKK